MTDFSHPYLKTEIDDHQRAELESLRRKWDISPEAFGSMLDEWFRNFEKHDLDLAYAVVKNIEYFNPHRFADTMTRRGEDVDRCLRRNGIDLGKDAYVLVTPDGGGDSAHRHGYDLRQQWKLSMQQVKTFSELEGEPLEDSVLVLFNDTHGSGKQFVRRDWDRVRAAADRARATVVVGVEIAVAAHKRFQSDLNRVYVVPDSPATASIDALVKKPEFDRIKTLGELVWPEHPLGYENSGLLVAYYFQTPNNSLPIIWANGENNKVDGRRPYPWRPLFERHEKIPYSRVQEREGKRISTSQGGALQGQGRTATLARSILQREAQQGDHTEYPVAGDATDKTSVTKLPPVRYIPELNEALLRATYDDILPLALLQQLGGAADQLLSMPQPGPDLAVMLTTRHLQKTGEAALARRLEQLLATPGLSDLTMAYGLHILGWAQDRATPQLYGPLHALERALTASLSAGAEGLSVRSQILTTLGRALRGRKSFETAQKYLEESIALKDNLRDWVGLEMSRLALGWMWLMRGKVKSGRAHFAAGIRATLDRLEHPPDNVSSEQMPAVALSLPLHVIGFSIACFIDSDPTDEFWELYDDVHTHLESMLRLVGASARSVFQEALDVLDLGVATPLLEISGMTRQAYVESFAECMADPAKNFGRFRQRALESMGDSQVSGDSVMKWYGIVSLLYYRSGSSLPSFSLLQASAECLSAQGYDGIQMPIEPKRTDGVAHQAIDASARIAWGPLGPMHDELRRAGDWLNPILTGQYLQILAWCSAVLLAADAGIDRETIYHLLATTYPDDSAVRLNVGQSFGVCARVAQLEPQRPVTTWGQSLRTLWQREPEVLREVGYTSRTALAEERNRIAHGARWRPSEIDAMLERHSRLIDVLSEPLRGGDLPAVLPSREVAIGVAGFVAARLSSPLGEFECGALLLMRDVQPTEFAVPHFLHRTSLLGRKGHSSEYIVLSHSAPTRLALKWRDSGSGRKP